jgi:hypothetical protein
MWVIRRLRVGKCQVLDAVLGRDEDLARTLLDQLTMDMDSDPDRVLLPPSDDEDYYAEPAPAPLPEGGEEAEKSGE